MWRLDGPAGWSSWDVQCMAPRCNMQYHTAARARSAWLSPAGVGVTKLGVLNMGEANAEKDGMWLGPAAELGSC
jgi:hypothetical protein